MDCKGEKPSKYSNLESGNYTCQTIPMVKERMVHGLAHK